MRNLNQIKRCLAACTGAAIALALPSATLAQGGTDCPDFDILFSLDIGSDTELSDPFLDGDEVFDPGDLYSWLIAPALPANGLVDDALFFGADPPPDPFAFGSAAPTCTGAAIGQIIDEYFDLDGADIIEFQLDLPPDVGLTQPFPFPAGSPCIHRAQKLYLSWDDDIAPHYADPSCPVPVASPSPFVGGTFGTTVGKDEVFSFTVTPTVPTPIGPIVSELDERGLNASLTPNPDAVEEDDDDCDALDLVLAPVQQLTLCPWVYWSPDHEAKLGLDPGDIYVSSLFGPAGFALAIDDVAHLGISDDADVDAFEFVGAENPDGTGGLALAIIFSVDDDDPLTPPDESGGLFPDAIYISFFMGTSTIYVAPLGEDIDAISNWCEDSTVPTGACCFCDGSCIDGMLEADCIAAGGKYQGDGSICVPGACEPFGACCFCDGTCADMLTAADCLAAAGTYQGDCSTCAAGQCEATGACCLCDGTCIADVSALACTSPPFNGTYQGDCTDCATANCEPTGACCLCDGTCIDDVTAAVCTDPLALNGKYQGDCTDCANTQCEPYGACCLPDGTCVDMVTLFICESPLGLGGTYQGDCSDCTTVNCDNQSGACCFGCTTYPGGPPFVCVDVASLADCCALEGLFKPGMTCGTFSCTQTFCPGDLDGDNDVDVIDFGVFASNFGKCIPAISGRCDGDFNCDGCVTVLDFSILAGNFGCSLPPIAPQCCGP